MQGKPLFDRKKRLSRLEKGVSLILLKASPSPSEGGDVLPRGCFFNSKIQLSLFLLTILFHPTNSIHAPLHSERGRGRGCFFNSKIQLSIIPLTTLSHPTNSIHAPLHSERGRGRGFSSLLKRALSLMNNGLDDDFTLLSLCENLRCDLCNILCCEGLEDRF